MAREVDVVMVTTSYPRFEGDFAGHFVASLASALVQQGARVTVIAPHAPGLAPEQERDGVRVRFVRYARDESERLAYGDGIVPNLRRDPRLFLRIPQLARAMRRVLAEESRAADVVHVHWAPTALLSGARSCETPVVLSLHGSDVTLARRGSVFRGLLSAAVRAAHHVIVVAASQSAVLSTLGVAPDRQSVIPSGVPVELTQRPRPGRSGSATVFAFVGRLVQSKGVLELLDAFSAASSADACLRLEIAGKGPLAGQIEDLIRARDLQDRVTMHGEVSHEAALELIAASDALVLPSHGEGSPLVVTEALALGTPVIGTPVGAVPELIGGSGLIVPVADAVALEGALREFAARSTHYSGLALAGRKRMADDYGWPDIASRTLEVYERAMNRSEATG